MPAEHSGFCADAARWAGVFATPLVGKKNGNSCRVFDCDVHRGFSHATAVIPGLHDGAVRARRKSDEGFDMRAVHRVGRDAAGAGGTGGVSLVENRGSGSGGAFRRKNGDGWGCEVKGITHKASEQTALAIRRGPKFKTLETTVGTTPPRDGLENRFGRARERIWQHEIRPKGRARPSV